MEEIDLIDSINKVCGKRVVESSHLLNPRGDAGLVSDGSVPDSPVFSVESVSMDARSGDPMVPVTPHSKCEGVGVDYRLGLDDSPSPPAFLNQQCGGGGLLEVECYSSSPPAFPNQKLFDFDSQCKDGVFLNLECDFLSPVSSSNQKLVLSDSRLEDGGFSSEDTPLTPKKDVFDPFAPGPDKLNWAPYRGKRTEQSKVCVSRKLKFDLCTKFPPNNEDLSVSEEEILFQSVYSDLLEVIISTQTKECGKIPCELSFQDGCQTPTVPPLLTGVADTCPGAPIKTSNKFIKIDKELCRKLEF